MKERLYTVRYRLRDGQQRVWEVHPKHLRLDAAQELADQLWDQGNETIMTAVGNEFDSST